MPTEPVNNEGLANPAPVVVAPTPEPTPVVAPVVEAVPVAPQPVVPTPAPVTQPAPTPAPVQGERNKEQFEKLLENNRRLFESNQLLSQELNRRNASQETFQPIQQVPTTPIVQPRPQDFVEIDPLTGEKFVNEQKLQAALADTNERATRAERAIQNYIQASEKREIERQNTEAFGAHPDLNPRSASFDVNLHNQTSAVILHSMMNPQNYGGRPLSFKEAADFVKGQITGGRAATQVTQQQVTPQEVQVQPAPERPSTQEQKEQASATIPSQPQQAAPVVNEAEMRRLQDLTRKGDLDALARRLVNTDHTGSPTGGL